jgi:hypothetical protein
VTRCDERETDRQTERKTDTKKERDRHRHKHKRFDLIFIIKDDYNEERDKV